MTRILLGQIPTRVLNAAVETGAGVPIDVSNYDEITIQVFTTASATATIKFAVSLSQTKPNFGAAASATNVYDFVDITPLNNQATPIVGGTGIVLSGTDIIKLYTIDTRFVKWICPVVTAYTQGSLNCELNAANNYTR